MVVKRFFSYTGEWAGFDRHETADKAKAAVQEAIEAIDEAWDPGGAEVWCWGEVREGVAVTVVHTHGPECMGEDDGCPEGYEYPEEDQDVADVSLVAVPHADAQPWIDFAHEVARELAPPDAQDLAAMTGAGDLPTLMECLRGTLAQESATIARLRADLECLRQMATLTAMTLLAEARPGVILSMEGPECADVSPAAVPSPEVDTLRADLAQAREELASLRALVSEGLGIVEALSAGYGLWAEAARAASSPPVVAP